ncbi:MAG: ABC transporter permease [Candidatus Heimdallarchaeota archaeon]|nr:ABC transporter permease [Candidatus Heimdallarchaeota archaeon]
MDLSESFRILFSSREVWGIVGLSLTVSLSAVLISSLAGVPFGYLLNNSRFKGKRLLIAIINTGMGLPPVLIGLVVYLSFTRAGPLGSIRILFTPFSMILAQIILTLPIVIGVTRSTLSELSTDLPDTLRSLGATEDQIQFGLLREARVGILTGITLALGRAFAEVGAIMIVGGNIRYHTRVLTTAIITEVSKGDGEMALALGIILITISFLLTSILSLLQNKQN